MWETEVTEARWDDDGAAWSVQTQGPRRQRWRHCRRGAVISAVGQLNEPASSRRYRVRSSSPGRLFHSAEWDHSVDLRGKRVALIGAGASGFQIAPAIADQTSIN